MKAALFYFENKNEGVSINYVCRAFGVSRIAVYRQLDKLEAAEDRGLLV